MAKVLQDFIIVLAVIITIAAIGYAASGWDIGFPPSEGPWPVAASEVGE